MIHQTAVVDPAAELADDVVIGPGCVITGPVKLGAGVTLMANVYLQGPLTVGERTRFWPGACVGTDPQDYKVKPGFPTAGVVVGADCLIREGATVHAATKTDVPTRLGDRVFMMVNSHVGHDALVGNDVILVNGALLAGHVEVGDRATLSGNSCVHQFCRVGRFAFASGGAVVTNDLPPFLMAQGRNALASVNMVGMRRNGFARADVTLVRRAFREVFRANAPRSEMVARLEALAREGEGGSSPALTEMVEFVRSCRKTIMPYRPQSGRTSDGEGDE